MPPRRSSASTGRPWMVGRSRSKWRAPRVRPGAAAVAEEGAGVTVGAAEATASAALTCSLPIDPSDSFGRDACRRDREEQEPPVFAGRETWHSSCSLAARAGRYSAEVKGFSFLKGVRE